MPMKTETPSAALAKVIGSEPVTRMEATSKLWAYIHKNGCQATDNKREIVCDDNLKAVMGKPRVTMFEMAKLISPHLT